MKKVIASFVAAAKGFVRKEPLVVRSAIGFAVDAVVGWGLPLNASVKATIIAVVSGVVLAWARQGVTPAKVPAP